MSEENKNVETNAAPVGGTESTGGDSGNENKTYDENFVSKIKGEKENFKTRAQQLENELNELKRANKEAEENRLKEQNDWKTLFEKKSQDYDALKSKVDNFEKSKVDSNKSRELANELKKLGINDAYIEKASTLADLTKIKIDDETGVIYGADVVAKSLQDEWPALFGGEGKPNVSQSAPSTMQKTSKLTIDEWKKLPFAERKKRESELFG